MLGLLEDLMAFCDYLKEIKMDCDTCLENGIGACHIRPGTIQKYYEKFKLYDTIQVIRHDHKVAVETDIEVTYTTQYPYGLFAGKGAEFAAEYTEKEVKMRDFLESKLPPGTAFLTSHQHYHPDKHDPNVVAMHIHVYKGVEDLDEAKVIVKKLVETIKPQEIEAAIKG